MLASTFSVLTHLEAVVTLVAAEAGQSLLGARSIELVTAA